MTTSPNVVDRRIDSPELSLETAFRDHGHAAPDDRLRNAISGYVYAMKAQGMTAQGVIINLQRIGGQAFMQPIRVLSRTGQPSSREEEIISGAVSVGIGLYFGGKH